MEYFLLFLIIALVAGGLYLIFKGPLGMKFHVVPEEKRLVIYRLGKFQRIAGPGPVITWRFDTIERELNVRDAPHDLRVDNLYMKGIPFGYTLNIWLHPDPVAAAAGSRERLRDFALFTDREREQQIAVKLREAIVKVVVEIEQTYKLRDSALTFEKLLPIFPGLPLCEQLLATLKTELQRSLPSIGVQLNEQQPITITALHLNTSILNGFKQGHIATLLREQYPDLSSERILRSVSTIDGIDLQEQRVVLGGDGEMKAAMDFRQGKEGVESRLKTYLSPYAGAPAKQKASAAAPFSPPAEETLTHDDLQILKEIPRYRSAQNAEAS